MHTTVNTPHAALSMSVKMQAKYFGTFGGSQTGTFLYTIVCLQRTNVHAQYGTVVSSKLAVVSAATRRLPFKRSHLSQVCEVTRKPAADFTNHIVILHCA